MKDRHLVSNMRNQLHDMRDELVGVRMRIMPGARTAAIERARLNMLEAMSDLDEVLHGRLEGDPAPGSKGSTSERFLGIDQRAGDRR